MSHHQWGRSPDAGRHPIRWPVYTLTLLPLALAVGIGLAVCQYQITFTTLQRWYLSSYLKSSYLPRLAGGDPRLASYLTHGEYRLVDLVDDRYIARQPKRYAHTDIELWLRETIYDGRAVGQLAWWPVAVAAGIAIIGLCAAIPLDVRRLRILRDGKILRGGPRPRTAAEFNRQHRQNDGIRIQVRS